MHSYRLSLCTIVAVLSCVGPLKAQDLSKEDSVRVREFYRLAAETQDSIWPGWSKTPAPVLLVTAENEFLFNHPTPPTDFKRIASNVYARPRKFPTNLLATFPAFGPPAVIVIGEPQNTESKTSTPWVITLMHEHFHQLQNDNPGYFDQVARLDLANGDTSGMWMLNYPFPYGDTKISAAYGHLRDLLLQTVAMPDGPAFRHATHYYLRARQDFFAQLSPSDHKYLGFQLWQEGIARYTQIKAAEAAAHHQSSAQYSALPDYESFADYAAHARKDTLDELKRSDLPSWKRTVVYAFGAAEGLLLDRLNPKWKDHYFEEPLSTDRLFPATH